MTLPPADKEQAKNHLDTLKSGTPLTFVRSIEESPAERSARKIPATLITQLVSQPSLTISVPIEINNAIIEGQLDLRYVKFESGLTLSNCEFTDKVDLSFATFQRAANFAGSEFKQGFHLRAATAKCDLRIDETSFADDSIFSDLHVEEIFRAEGATFGHVEFYRIEVKKRTSFNPVNKAGQLLPTRFKGEAIFGGATFTGNADFRGAQFEGKANFNGVRFGRNAFFGAIDLTGKRIATRFNGETDFHSSQIQGDANFRGAQFGSSLNFSLVKIAGGALFGTTLFDEELFGTRFVGECTFYGCEVGGNVEFRGAQFDKHANFTLIKVEGETRFSAYTSTDQVVPTQFSGEASFYNAQLKSNADFRGTQFVGPAVFDRSYIGGNALFRHIELGDNLIRTVFSNDAFFFNAHFKGDADFQAAKFDGRAVFSLVTIENRALFQGLVSKKKKFETFFGAEANFSRASIQSDARFSGAHFIGIVHFNGAMIGKGILCRPLFMDDCAILTEFDSEANFVGLDVQDNAEFDGVVFKNSAKFDRMVVNGLASFSIPSPAAESTATSFHGEVNFYNAHFRSDADFRGTDFHENANFGAVEFDRTARFNSREVDGRVFRTCFGGRADFYSAQIKGDMDLHGAHFKREANFSQIRIEGESRFVTLVSGSENFPVCFGAEAKFYNAHFENNCYFLGVQFQGKTLFDRIEVAGNAIFRSNDSDHVFLPCSFGGDVTFRGAHIHGEVEFQGARFLRRASFVLTKIDLRAQFCSAKFRGEIQPTIFHNEANFEWAEIGGALYFDTAKFLGQVRFNGDQVTGDAIFRRADFGSPLEDKEEDKESDIDFEAARLSAKADFSDSLFYRRAIFDRVEIKGTANFQGVQFLDGLSLRDAYFHIFLFHDEAVKPVEPDSKPSRLHAVFNKVDLRGFSYDRISPEWRRLFTAMQPYDRQPYSFIEKQLRSTGDDREADNAYLLRRKHERSWIWQRVFNERRLREFPKFAFDLFQSLLFNHGVRPYRLIFLSLVIIALGVYMFSQPNAVKIKEPTPSLVESVPISQKLQLNKSQALGFSLRLFLPVEIASGSDWVPTQEPAPLLSWFRISYAGYASFHRLAGFVLVPLGVIVLTGLLRRQAKP